MSSSAIRIVLPILKKNTPAEVASLRGDSKLPNGEDGNVAHVVLSKEVGAVGEEETKVNLERFIDNAIQKIEFRTGLKREVGKDDSLFQWVSYRPSLLFGAVYENVNGESCVAMVSMVDINRSL